MDSLLNFTLPELEQKLTAKGLQKFRAKQVFVALHQGLTFDEMTTLSSDTKNLLNAHYLSQSVKVLKTIVSSDGTEKYLFQLPDNNIVEGVLMKYKFGNTLCVSTQVGCAMGCTFCASTMDGLVRNLTAGEMLGQVVTVNRLLKGGTGENRNITNVVLMGSGEPLSNYDHVTKFIRLLTDENGLCVSERNITLSTCGIVPNIYRLADDGFKVTLSVSLHAPNDEIRKSIMLVAKGYTVSQLLDACRYYAQKTNRRVSFEYILINQVNASLKHAQELAQLLKGLQTQVNLIPLNEVKGRNLKTVSKNQTLAFLNELHRLGVQGTIRRTLGDDIEGACGQLRRRYLENETSNNNETL